MISSLFGCMPPSPLSPLPLSILKRIVSVCLLYTSFEDFKADPDGCLQILLDNQNEEHFPLSKTVEEKSCEVLLPLMETADAKFLSQTDDCWQENIDWMLETGLIDKAVDCLLYTSGLLHTQPRCCSYGDIRKLNEQITETCRGGLKNMHP